MKRFKIKNKNRKVIAEVFSFMDEVKSKYDKDEIINSILKQIKLDNKIGYAGFRNKKDLKYNLKNYNIKSLSKQVNHNKIKKIIEKSIKKFSEFFKSKTSIFIFPTNDQFILKRMNGVSGYNPWKDTILVYLNHTIKNWECELKETIAHESTHIFDETYKNNTLLDAFISEGMAEHFREYIIGGGRAPWSKAITKKEAIKLFKKLKPKLNNKNLFSEVFLGAGRYPLWAGYTIGYYILEDYLKKQKKIDWKKIIKTKPKVILKEFMKTYNFSLFKLDYSIL